MKLSGRKKGFALVVTLMVVALVVVLFTAIALLSAGESQRAGAGKGGVVAHLLAESAMNLALAKVRSAVEDREETGGEPALWTSQPGLVRTYREDGTPLRYHKLYTSAEGTVEGDAERLARSVANDIGPVGGGDFVDINSPKRLPSGELQFPVADPRGMAAEVGESVEGFGYGGDSAPGGTVLPGGAPDAQRLPMPVRWVYMLDDGTLTVEQDRRAVGRIAFWVDDESSKININTASEGVFWDSPRASTNEERALADNQPARGEYQRFPGHPAMVSLSSVLFPGQRIGAAGMLAQPRADGSQVEALDLAAAEAIWEMAPGVHAGADTSLGGTRPPAGAGNSLAVAEVAPEPERARLYPSVAESLWDRGAPGSARRLNRVFREYPGTRTRLARGGFFLTADSAAPEMTPWGTPRIAMWPIHGNLNPGTLRVSGIADFRKVTTYDHKVAIANTLGDRRYYVTRSEAGSGERDFALAHDGVRHNADLYRYLTKLTSRPVPGTGLGSFADKYGEDHPPIVLGSLDYIRMVNLNDGELDAEEQFCVVCAGNEHVGFGQVSPLRTEEGIQAIGRVPVVSEVVFAFICRAQVMEDGTIEGVPSRAGIKQLLAPGDRELELAIFVEGSVPGHGWGEYRPYASIGLGSVALGDLEGGGEPTPDYSESKLPALTVGGSVLELESGEVRTSESKLPGEWRAWGASAGIRIFNDGMLRYKPFVVPAGSGGFSFSGTVAPAAEGGETRVLTLTLFDEPATAGSRHGGGESDRLRTIVIAAPDIPEGALKLPELPRDGTPYPLKSSGGRVADRAGAMSEGTGFLAAGDIIQSLVLRHGDTRIEAGRRYSGLGRDGVAGYVAHPDWGVRSHAHSLREPTAEGQKLVDENHGSLVPGFFPDLPVAASAAPDLPVRAGGQGSVRALVGDSFATVPVAKAAIASSDPAQTGDFDNGFAFAPDGAYINRADDGDTRGYGDGGSPYFSVPPPEFNKFPQPDPATFSPKRLLPSAAMLGSLPTGTASQTPWQTLLFRPDFSGGHPGADQLPDHHFLDYFWMPVVEPWPISRPFETAGKINLNHQIYPFTYVRRATALHALMKAEMVFAVPDTDAATYKLNTAGLHQETRDAHYRRFLDPAATLRLWDEAAGRRGGAFRTPSEVCTLPLVPEGVTDLGKFWKEHRLTGDNSKERPYAHLLPRLTTQSNVFRVHLVAQALRARRSDSGFEVTGEVRGSALLRREIPFENRGKDLPDYLSEDGEQPRLETFARWQIGSFEEF